jgi:hypothetical protein
LAPDSPFIFCGLLRLSYSCCGLSDLPSGAVRTRVVTVSIDGSSRSGQKEKNSLAREKEGQAREKGGIVKKLSFLLGLGVGFLIGSKAGSGPYEQIEKKVRSVTNRPEVQEVVDNAKATGVEQVQQAANKVNAKMPSPKESVS